MSSFLADLWHDTKFLVTQFREDRITHHQYLLSALMRLRVVNERMWRRKFGRLGANPIIKPTVYAAGLKRIEIGDNVKIQDYVNLHAYIDNPTDTRRRLNHHFLGNSDDRKLIIGNDVTIAPYAYVAISDHNYRDADKPIRKQGMKVGRIVIEDDVWIGAFSVVVGTVRIGRGAVIGAHTVVKNDVEPMAIVVGNPAKVIGYRRSGEAGTSS